LKYGVKLKFNIVVHTRKGALFCCMMKHGLSLETEAADTKSKDQMR
jgi:hypothetical protein